MKNNIKWDIETEVVVVGIGASGAISAINAHDYGAEVIVLEKMHNPGGSSILAGGAVKSVHNVEKAVEYLSCTQGGRVKKDLIETFAKGLYEIPQYIEKLSEVNLAKLAVRKSGNEGVYCFPGAETFFTIYVKDIPGFSGYINSKANGNLNGQRLIKLFIDNVNKRNIPIYYDSPVEELIKYNDTIIGVKARIKGSVVNIMAKKAVVLASGGFEFNEKLKKEYFEATPVYSIGNPGNTGDGILMSQKVGAALWHMWHFHGSYGFKFEDRNEAIRISPGGVRNIKRKLPWILVDKNGKRFMNEYHPAPQDTMHRPMEYFDPDIPGYPRIPAYMIFDEEGRKIGKIGNPLGVCRQQDYEWSNDNSVEIEKGWIKVFDTIEEIADYFKLDRDNLVQTINSWNRQVDDNEDLEFKRPSGTITHINVPPFYAVPVWPICTNTQGGPEHDENQRVLDPYGKQIRHLYSVGELGSFFGHLYLLGGNLSECVISGRIAGKNAALENVYNE